MNNQTGWIGREKQGPMVGRQQELNALHEVIVAAEHCIYDPANVPDHTSTISWVAPNRRPLMVISGAVGIGKTRFAEEASREADQRGWVVLWSRAYTQENAPYQLWIEIIRQAMRQDLWSDICKEIHPEVLQPLTVLLPELISFFAQYGSASTPAAASAFAAYEELVPLKLWDAALAMITGICKQGPVMIVLDDLQWADQSSCDLLSYLCRHLVDDPVVFLGTSREENITTLYPFRPQLLQLQRELLVNTLHLAALTDQQIAHLVASIKDPGLVQHIQNLADGNPFFAEELARVIHQQSAAHGAKVAQERLLTITLPRTITDVFDQRLKRLSVACLNTLRAASVLGGTFSCTTMLEMERTGGGEISEEDLLTHLEEALQSGLLTEQGHGAQVRFLFWHPLLAHHLYEGIFGARRALLHRRAARTLQREYARRSEEGAAVILYHLQKGDAEPAQIAHYAELAAQRAYSLCAFVDAERYYRLALRTMEQMTQGQLTVSGKEQQQAIVLQEYLSECLRIQGRFQEANAVYTHIYSHVSAQFLAMRQSPTPPDTETCRTFVQYQAVLLAHIGKTYYDQANVKQAFSCYLQAEQMLAAEGVLDGAMLAYLRFTQSYNYLLCGSYAMARTRAQQSCELLEKALQQRVGPDTIIDYTESDKASGIVLQVARTGQDAAVVSSPLWQILRGNELDLAGVYALLGKINSATGRCSTGLGYLQRALQIYERHDCQQKLVMVNCDLGDVYLRQAEYTQAREKLQQALHYIERTQQIPLASFVLLNLCIVAVRCGDLVAAEEHIKQAMQLTTRFDDTLDMAKVVVRNQYALLLAEQGKLPEAQTMLHSALSMARRLRLHPLLGYTALTLGHLRLQQAHMLDRQSATTGLFAREQQRFIRRARHTFEHLLTLDDIEPESRYEGQIALLEIASLTQKAEPLQSSIYEQARAVSHTVQQAEAVWLLPRVERLLGSVLRKQGDYQQASEHFEEALALGRRYDMRLECARTLQSYASMLNEADPAQYRRSEQYLAEAQEIFRACGTRLASGI